MALLSGLKNSTETVKKRACELVQVNKIYKARVVSCFGPGNYSIEFPHVTEVLMKENLLPAGESDIHELLHHLSLYCIYLCITCSFFPPKKLFGFSFFSSHTVECCY